MKKLLAMLIALSLTLSLAACGGNNEPETNPENENIVTDAPSDSGEENKDEPSAETSADNEAEEEKKDDDKPVSAPEDANSETNPAAKPQTSTKPAEDKKPVSGTPAKPAEKPAEKPAAPVTPPQNNTPAPEKPSAGGNTQSATVGETLAAVWRANSSKSAEQIANAVLSHSSIQFMGGVVPVEEGFLTGFDNTEIKGFSSGYMFAPAIGTIPFVGYVFELSDASGADAFVSTLKGAANPRWNICTEAEQTIVEKNGNKVFFLMCPKTFEE
ncbi:MAG: hypothetical protein IJ299_05365 [Oscillospiraceae bacterium]|nr:hypothetical protein [Oscillospiraceae bacterium]